MKTIVGIVKPAHTELNIPLKIYVQIKLEARIVQLCIRVGWRRQAIQKNECQILPQKSSRCP